MINVQFDHQCAIITGMILIRYPESTSKVFILFIESIPRNENDDNWNDIIYTSVGLYTVTELLYKMVNPD